MNYTDDVDVERWMSFVAATITPLVERVRSTILQNPMPGLGPLDDVVDLDPAYRPGFTRPARD